MNIIACVDTNWGIGYKGELFVKIKEDLAFFKEKTLNKTIIMGNETFKSLPCILPNRKHIVLSKTIQESNSDMVEYVNNINEIITRYQDDDNAYVIGGQTIYEQLLPYCKNAYITKVDEYFEVDRYFPNLEKLDNWRFEDVSVVRFDEKNRLCYEFIIYTNKKRMVRYEF